MPRRVVKLTLAGGAIAALGVLFFFTRRQQETVEAREEAPLRQQKTAENQPSAAIIAETSVRGRLLMPDGSSPPDGTRVFLVRADRAEDQSILATVCPCAGCTREQAIDACDELEPSLLRKIDGGGGQVAAEHTTTTRDGAFQFSGLGNAEYFIWAQPVGAASIDARFTLKNSAEITLNAPEPESISGKILLDDNKDSPAQNARVLAIDPFLGERKEAIAGPDGSYSIDGLSSRTWWWIVAVDPSWTASGVLGIEAGSKDIDIWLAAAATLSGVVLDRGAPVAGAKIDAGDDQPEIISDVKGRFSFAAIAAGYRQLHATKNGKSGAIALDLDAGERRDVQIDLFPACRLSVFVGDQDGVPLAEVLVRAVTPEDLAAERQEDYTDESEVGADERETRDEVVISGGEAETDDSGSAVIEDLAVGSYVVEATHDALGSAENTVKCSSGEPLETKLSIGGGPSLSGVVLGADHKPIAGAQIELELDRDDVRLDESSRLTRTNDEGRFRVASLAAGEWAVYASAEGFVPEEKELIVKSGDQTMEIVLEHAQGIRGIVQLQNGTPLRGWNVSALAKNTEVVMLFAPDTDAVTGPDGRFVIEGLAPGEYRVEAYGQLPDGQEQMSGGTTAFTNSEATIVIGDFGVIEGELRIEGAAFPDEVFVAIGETKLSLTQQNRRFRVRVRPSVSLPVQAHAENFPAHVETVAIASGETKTHNIVLSAGAVLSGRVLEKQSKTPIAGVHVVMDSERYEESFEAQVRRHLEGPSAVVTDAEGRFWVRGFRPGKFQIIAMHDRHPTAHHGSIQLESGKPQEIEILMERGVNVSGVARYGQNPARSAHVAFSKEGSASQSVNTDRQGRFKLNLPAPGTWKVRITVHDDLDGQDWSRHEMVTQVEIAAAGRDDLTLAIPAGSAKLTVEVPPSTGLIEELLLVSGSLTEAEASFHQLMNRQGLIHSVQSDRGQKTAVFSGLVPGEYTLVHRPDGVHAKLTTVRISGEQNLSLAAQ